MLLPLLASVLIVFGSPYVGQIRSALQSSFPEYYRWIIGGSVAVAAMVAIGSAIGSLRWQQGSSTSDRSVAPPLWVRYALIALAVAMSAAYARAMRTGNLDVDLVEAFHFVEYGLLAYLFHRAWRGLPDLSGMVFAACAGLAVGVADEAVQWFVPGRVGELHDVWLNGAAIGCGLLFSAALHPPSSLAMPSQRRSRLAVGAAVSGLLVLVAGFVDGVHFGVEVNAGTIGVFRSQYDARALAAAAADRAARWRTSPPPLQGWRREDHYMSEGLWHVQHRNLSITAGDSWAAWNENAILERFFAPVLDQGHRLPLEQRVEIEQRARGSAHVSYVSDATPYPIYLVRRSTFWAMTAFLGVAILGLFRGPRAAAARSQT